jgi:hypothetical protein
MMVGCRCHNVEIQAQKRIMQGSRQLMIQMGIVNRDEWIRSDQVRPQSRKIGPLPGPRIILLPAVGISVTIYVEYLHIRETTYFTAFQTNILATCNDVIRYTAHTHIHTLHLVV